ncbi:MAG: hypothetical protein V1750_01385 [Acidobacteriota bacterium]
MMRSSLTLVLGLLCASDALARVPALAAGALLLLVIAGQRVRRRGGIPWAGRR